MTEDLKAAVDHCNSVTKYNNGGYFEHWAIETLITHATRHSDNVEAVTGEKRKAALIEFIASTSQWPGHKRVSLCEDAYSTIEAALKQPDKTIEALKGVRDALQMIADRPHLPNPERDADWKNCMKNSSYEARQQLTALNKIIEGE